MNPREEHETLIRLDENVKTMMTALDRGIEKFDKIDVRLSDLEIVSAKHEKFMSEHPGICSDLEKLEKSFIDHNASEKGVSKGLSTAAIVGVGVLNIIVMLFNLYIMVGG